MRISLMVVFLLTLGTRAGARELTPMVQDSMLSVHPRLRAHWLKERGIDMPGYTSPFQRESLNMRCVGRWSYGPSYDVTGRITATDTIVFMARGSGVSVLRFHGGAQPGVRLLSDINALGLVRRVVVQDSWLFVGTSGIEVYNVARPQEPVKVAWINTVVSDLAIEDSFLYSVNSESLTVFNIAGKTNPFRVGAVADSGSSIAVAGGKAYLTWGTFGWHGMYILDVSNPRAPHRAGTWGSGVWDMAARGNLCFASGLDNRFHIIDATNPGAPQELSSVGAGGLGVYVRGSFAYLSGFAVVDIADSLMPGIVGQVSLGGGDVWATGDYGYAFSACWDNGLAILDYRDPVNPRLDTIGVLAYDDSRDISVQGSHAIIANDSRGAKILDIANPVHPFEIASYDTAGPLPYCDAARLSGSLAYMDWQGWDGWRGLYVISCAESANPVLVGRGATFNPIEAMAIRDSWLYAGEGAWFEVVSIGDSLRPYVASRCSLRRLAGVSDVCVNDSIAYVANIFGGLRMINVARPRSATPIGFYTTTSSVYCVATIDTIAFAGTGLDLRILNVRNPGAPLEIGSYGIQGANAIAVRGNVLLMYGGLTLTALDISDPAHPVMVGFYEPCMISNFVWRDSLIYASCLEHGVLIWNYAGGSGCRELRNGPVDSNDAMVTVLPNPTSGKCRVCVSSGERGFSLRLYDSAGRLIERGLKGGINSEQLDLNGLRSGVYFLETKANNKEVMTRVVLVN